MRHVTDSRTGSSGSHRAGEGGVLPNPAGSEPPRLLSRVGADEGRKPATAQSAASRACNLRATWNGDHEGSRVIRRHPGQQNAHPAFPQVGDAQSPARGLVARGGVEPPTFRFSVGRSYQLSYLALVLLAVLTGLEPATSALTGRRALQLLHRTLLFKSSLATALPLWLVGNSRYQPTSTPNGIRTRATALKGRRPGPLDDEGNSASIARLQHFAA